MPGRAESAGQTETNDGLVPCGQLTCTNGAKRSIERPGRALSCQIPSELEAIIMKCLEKDPADRFQDARELAAALREVPLTEPWDAGRADEWWDLHMRAASVA